MTFDQKAQRLAQIMLFVLFLGLTSATAAAGQTTGDRILGTWTDETESMEIKFEQCADAYCASITSIEDGSDHEDVHNRNSSLRDRPLVGLRIINGLRYQGDEWSGGTMYVPKKGIHVGVKLSMTKPGELRMTVSKLFFRRQATWTRTTR